MSIHETLIRERTFHNVPGNSKKRVLENASELIAETVESLEAEDIFSGLIGRERLGSTGLGDGVAIPHCRLENCQEVVGTLVKLPEPIDYDSIDGNPVDLLFLLLVPTEATEAHLQTLASLAERFSQEAFRKGLRDSENAEGLYQAFINFN
ncbi:PTS IIA-like nitrogen regulatory protein PtsN [Motiliproteus sp. MSK22-1]|uniref:PTS IIA-like nitrogen regulatory protein PtsN n=1 Tax=Motiliproteus sp. MSK22-1 TaxID=1897630 RepID=UPI000975572A|nr:PTS IIA-like nitrogen regulatory protein PtsN [Motiliproteus sp. MSK22-1]OMH30367.1 PTS IIA-like nitrogen-regulatory protein PtsN [Motiliproteus sp. MSK22-1]